MHPFQNLPLYDIPDSQISTSSGSPDNQYWIFIRPEEEIDTQLKKFLAKILAAIDIDLATSINLLTLDSTQRIYIHKLIGTASKEKNILCFGLSSKDLGLNFRKQLYQLIHLDGHTFLFCELLSAIQSDANKKKALWESLQSFRPKK